jgi:hypothetical protein
MTVFVPALIVALQAPAVPVPYASAVSFMCEMHDGSGNIKILSGEIAPIVEATGYGSAAAKITRDDTKLIKSAKSAMLTGSTQPPRWYQIAVPIENKREYMLQLYLFPHPEKGHAFIVEQEGGLRLGGYRSMAVGLCTSNIVSVGTAK